MICQVVCVSSFDECSCLNNGDSFAALQHMYPCSQYTIPHADHNLCLAQRRLYFMRSVTDRHSPGSFLFLVHRFNSACLFFPSPVENIAHMLSKGNLCCKTIALKINLCVMYIKITDDFVFILSLFSCHTSDFNCACVCACVC